MSNVMLTLTSIAPQRRDLIASADTILNMARTCEAVLGNVKSVQVCSCTCHTSRTAFVLWLGHEAT